MNIAVLFDPFITIPIVGLTGISLSLIGSTSPALLNHQILFFILGFSLFLLLASIEISIWKEFVWIFYFLTLFLLLITFFGPEVRGATRWIEIGAVRLQPAEIIKPLVVVVLAYHLTKSFHKGLFYLMMPIVLLLPLIVLIFKQPDLGNVIVFLISFFALEIAAGLPWRYVVVGIVFLLSLLPPMWGQLLPYQQARLLSFLSPYADPQGAGYNALQSIIAIGSGKLFGLGLGHGTQSHLLFLPEYYTDFIFASIAEELGFFGGALVIIFYFILLLRLLLISYTSESRFGKLLSVGIFSQLFIQIIINIGMNLGLLPITGITLPLLSYGGSSIISTFMGLGLVAAVARERKVQPLVIR